MLAVQPSVITDLIPSWATDALIGIPLAGITLTIGLIFSRWKKSSIVQLSVGSTKITFKNQNEFEGLYIPAVKATRLIGELSSYNEKMYLKNKDYLNEVMKLAENCSENAGNIVLKSVRTILHSVSPIEYTRVVNHLVSDSLSRSFKKIILENHLSEKASGPSREEFLTRKSSDLYRILKTTLYEEWPTETEKTEDRIKSIEEFLEKDEVVEQKVKELFISTLSSIIDITVQKEDFLKKEYEEFDSYLKLAFELSPELLAIAKLQLEKKQ